MQNKSMVGALAMLMAVCGARAGLAADWFVTEGMTGGDGTKAKPFHDPYLALRQAEPGDVIHIAAGSYHGRFDRGYWLVDRPRITLRGGYDRSFTKRTPWDTPTVFAPLRAYEGPREGNIINGNGDHSGLVLDGILFDASGRNGYGENPAPATALRSWSSMDGPVAAFLSPDVTIRNCIFVNSATGGIELAGEGSRFENNLVLNTVGTSMLTLRMSGGGVRAMTVSGNTFAFAHDPGDPPVGKGADNAIGIRAECQATITGNAFIACGNAGIAVQGKADRVAVDGNLFALSPFDVVKKRAGGENADIKEKNIEELEDVGLKSAVGNVTGDPGLTGLTPAWIDAWSRHMLASYATPPKEGVAKLRAAAGLPVLDKVPDAPDQKGGLAPLMTPAEAAGIRLTVKQGAHPVDLPVELGAPKAPLAGPYRPVEWNVLVTPNPALANGRVELVVGVGGEQNGELIAGIKPETHMGFYIFHPRTDDESLRVLVPRNTPAQRQWDEARKEQRAREVEDKYLVRGVYRTDTTGRQKATILVESIVPAPPTAADLPKPSAVAGRDWFVKAGASGGDGSKDKPFRDPFQALEKAEGGDRIHIAGGDYFGKLRSGKWTIPVRHLSLLGGYDATFAARDPWKNPTRFALNEEEKAKGDHGGTFLKSGDDPSDGLTLDGLVFDGSTVNNYTKGGSLNLRASPLAPLVDLGAGREPLTVRNCTFVNASGAAAVLRCPYGVFENNVVANTSGWGVGISADGTGPWIVRNNTIIFAADPTQRAGTGMSSSMGTLMMLSGRAGAAIEGNIFAFGDNFGLRCTLPKTKVSLTGNVFAGNLYCDFTDAQYLWAEGDNFRRRVEIDAEFAAARANTGDLPKVSFPGEFADVLLARIYKVPSRIPADAWKPIAAAVGAKTLPVAETAPTPVPDAKPAASATPPKEPSIDDLLADLNKIKQESSPSDKPENEDGPKFCPALDYKAALALAGDPGSGPGAHRVTLQVSFGGGTGEARPAVQYVKLTPAEVDAQRAALDNRPVELEVTDLRSSLVATLYPAGTSKDDYDAFSITTAGTETQTRMAIVVRKDTAASRLLDRVNARDTLRVRGTARITGSRTISVVVDTMERVDK
jgi:hypothetical protein